MVLDSGASITTEARRQGDAGSVRLNVGTLAARGDAQITSSSTGAATGDAGSITIQGLASPADSVSLTNSAVLTSAAGTGGGGSITVDTKSLALTNAVVSASVTDIPAGGDPATGVGNITLTASQATTLNDGTVISAQSHGTRNAGTVTIRAGQNFVATNSQVTTQAAQASGGNITLIASDMIRLRDSGISTSVFGPEGTVGGDIFIDPQFILLQNSQILAQAIEGRGGNINLTFSQAFLADARSTISASSQFGVSGTITINSPVQNLSGALVPLKQSFLSGTVLLNQRCAARAAGAAESSFIVTESEGLPPAPGGPLASPLWDGGETQVSGSGVEPAVLAVNVAPVGAPMSVLSLLPGQESCR
jgi:large exoprotein involved in heme utilization and adhesion